MKKWSLNQKVYFVIFIMAVGLCSVSVIGIYQMSNINKILETITQERVVNLVRTHEIMNHFYIQIINERNYVLHATVEARAINKGYIIKRHGEMREMIESRAKVSSPEGLKDLMEFKDVYAKWTTFNDQIQKLADEGKGTEAAALISETGRKLRLEGEGILNRMNERDTKRMDDETALANKAYANAKFMVIVASISALALGLILAIFTLKSVTRVIDEIIGSLSENSNQVTAAAGQIAASSEELSQAVTEQASSLEETAASIEEMSSMVQKNASNAQEATELANGSRENANKGQQVVVNMIHAIDDINTSNKNIMVQINESNQQISEIVNVIKEIASKTKVINDIVFQTKLLSFNASVEAARAGEQGKGFAVVAEEVGSLAQMSGNAADEISVLLDNSIHKVESIVKSTQEKVEVLIKEGSVKVETGTRIAKECGDVLEEIVDSTAKVTKMTVEISTASQEQSMGVQEITRAMNQLDQVTQTNTASSEEAASAAEQLSAQATSLKGVVDLLLVTIKGGDSAQVGSSIPVRAHVPNVANVISPTSVSNVVNIKSAPKKTTPAKTVHTKAVTKTPPPPVSKKAAGSSMIPSGNDPRFEDV
nr:methyl-accepting chemotaxis protein [Bacteriovorax sp. HI3]